MQSVRTAITFGEALLRLSAPFGHRLEQTQGLEVHAVGAEANVAAALAALGIEVAWVGVLPATPLGRRAASALRAGGVDLGLVDWVDDHRMGLFFVERGVGSRPTSAWYDRGDSAFARHARWRAGTLAGAAYAVVSGITPALGPAPARAVLDFAADARASRARLCVDVNYRARLWTPDAARAALEPLLAAADVVVCSAADAATVFGAAAGDARAFRERFAPDASLCVITQGDEGVVADADGELYEVAAIPTVVVDRLGMGDAFLAGLLSGLIDAAPIELALRRGTALAALTATVVGDQAAIARGELDAALEAQRPAVLR
jgi:2-dehydro-3-deoxygluconokinase